MSERRFLRVDVYVWIALLSYVVLALIFFWPLLTHLGNSVLKPYVIKPNALALRYGGRDAYHFLWNFWWVRTALGSGQNILYTNMFFYPQGVSLALQTVDYVDAVIAIPLTAVLGEVAAFNIIIIASFVLSGFTMFLLARHLTSYWLAAFSAGVIFAYAPQHISEALAGHPNLTSIEWIPALLLCLILMFEKRQFRYALIGGIMLAILTYTELELMILALIMGMIYVFCYLILTRFSDFKRSLVSICIVIITWLGISSPYILAAYESLGVVHAAPSLSDAIKNAARPELYLIPPPSTLALGNLFLGFYQHANLSGGPSQWVIFVGYTALALAIVGAITSKNRNRFIFIVIAIVAFLFSLGPSSSSSSISAQTPYTILYNSISILHYFRDEARFSFLLMLAVGILAAYGIDWMMKMVDGFVKKNHFTWGTVAGLIIVTLIILEFAPTIAVATVPSSPFFNKIAQDNSQYAVFELPAGNGPADVYLYEATIFHKPLINGKISQVGLNTPEYMTYQIFLCGLVHASCPAEGVIVQPFNVSQLAPVILTYYDIKYVIVNQGLIGPAKLQNYTNSLQDALGAPVYKDKLITVYGLSSFLNNATVENMAQVTPLTFFGANWTTPKSGSGIQVNGTASLVVYADQTGTYPLYIASSFPTACITNPELSGLSTQCGSYDYATGVATYDITLNQGENTLSLQSTGLSTLTMISFTQST